MRRFTAALAGICMLAAACAANSNTPAPAQRSTTSSTPPPPLAVSDLDPLLLGTDLINTAMGAEGMASADTHSVMVDDTTAVADENCRVAADPAETSSYTGSGWTALRDQAFVEKGDKLAHFAAQAVVLFPSANDAAAFFTASSQRWPACSNRQYTENQPGKPDQRWTVGPVTNTNGTLSTTQTQEGANGWGCGRALTVRNNVAIDVVACSYTPSNAAVNIAQQIADKVPNH